jgi:hypothetical protein
MKHQIKAGQEFNVINITVEAPVEKQKSEDFPVKKMITYVCIALITTVFASSVAYGAATGDYTLLKSIAEAGRDAFVSLSKVGATPTK